MDDPGELDPVTIALYRRALVQPAASAEELASSLEQGADKIDKKLAQLLDMGVLRTDDGRHYTAVSPMLAEATVLGAEDLELAARRAELEARRDSIRRLVPEWNISLTAKSFSQGVDLITEPSEINNVVMHYADQGHDETLSISPGQLPLPRVDGRTNTANHYALRRGIRIRALYQNAALRDKATVAYLSDLTNHGAKIRFAHAVPGRLIIIDREVGLLRYPTKTEHGVGLAVVHEPNVVQWLVATFEQLWNDATSLEEYLSSHDELTDIDPLRRQILRLMADGEKDEAISRKLSISVRTCRRHIAEYMAQVGANSRFQAGVIAARAGHTDEPVATDNA